MKRVAIIVVVVLVLLIGVPTLIGAFVPREHVASSSATYDRSPEVVFATITDIDDFPTWRDGVTAVERLPDREGRAVWRETTTFGPMTLEVVERDPPRLFKTRIADPDLGFGGTWTFAIEPTARGCELTITEDGFIPNLFFRFVARFVSGYHGTQQAYLRSLGSKFGQEVDPVEVR